MATSAGLRERRSRAATPRKVPSSSRVRACAMRPRKRIPRRGPARTGTSNASAAICDPSARTCDPPAGTRNPPAPDPRDPAPEPATRETPTEAKPSVPPPPPAPGGPVYKPGENVQVVPMSEMRKKIAEHMVLERAHLAARVLRLRGELRQRSTRCGRRRRRLQKAGAKLTFTAVHRQGRRSTRCASSRSSTPRSTVTTSSTRRTSTSASRWPSTTGLIVPVIKNADEKNLLGLSRAINDVADRARGEEAQSGGSPGRDVHDHEPRSLRRASTGCR